MNRIIDSYLTTPEGAYAWTRLNVQKYEPVIKVVLWGDLGSICRAGFNGANGLCAPQTNVVFANLI